MYGALTSRTSPAPLTSLTSPTPSSSLGDGAGVLFRARRTTNAIVPSTTKNAKTDTVAITAMVALDKPDEVRADAGDSAIWEPPDPEELEEELEDVVEDVVTVPALLELELLDDD